MLFLGRCDPLDITLVLSCHRRGHGSLEFLDLAPSSFVSSFFLWVEIEFSGQFLRFCLGPDLCTFGRPRSVFSLASLSYCSWALPRSINSMRVVLVQPRQSSSKLHREVGPSPIFGLVHFAWLQSCWLCAGFEVGVGRQFQACVDGQFVVGCWVCLDCNEAVCKLVLGLQIQSEPSRGGA
ncbi:hypothetical protein ACOSQ2_004738 [Xanthoceras sorbifolium]